MLKMLERRITLQLLVFYGLFVLPLLLGGVELYFFQRDALQQSAQQADLNLAQAIALEVDANIQSASNEALDLARSQAASQLNMRALASAFASAQLSHSDISRYIVCDASGKVLLAYPSAQAGGTANFGASTYFQRALGSDAPVISSSRMSVATRMYVVSIAARIVDDNGRVVGAVIINLSLRQLTARLVAIRQRLTNSAETRIWIVDSDGRSIADTSGSFLRTDLLDTLPELEQALDGKSGSLTAHEQGRDWLYSYVPVAGTGWAVAVQQPTDVTFAVVISFQHSLIIALVMLIAGATVFWFVMHGWVVAPLARLARAVTMIKPDQTKKVADSKLLAKDRSRNDEIGKLIAAFSTMEDEIHALFRKSDEKSQKRLHTLDAIMRSVDEAILLESPQGQVVYANHSFTQLVGISPQEVLLDLDSFADSHLAEKLLALLEDPEAYTRAVQRAEQGSGPPVVEFQVRGYYNEAGQWVPGRRDIRMRLFHVRDLAGQLIGRGKIFNDVTQQNEAEQVKKNLLAIVSHELRTPLTAIKGYATSLLETDVELDAALQQHFLQNIVTEGDRMADLVTSLLAMSQLEAGTLKLYPGLCRLDALLEQVVPQDERCRVRVCLPPDMPLLYIDRRRIEVVLCNLLENARRHAGAEAIVEISARYERQPPDGGLYLSVADNGPGFPEHLAERIFDRFYQIDSGTRRSSSGVGLGLAICRGFIAAHGGRIWAENRSDGVTGAVFHIWLPPQLLHTPFQHPQADRYPHHQPDRSRLEDCT